jgi:glutathione peroxidase
VSLRDLALTTLDGRSPTLAELSDGATLVVNVASKCGLTPQYSALERLAEQYAARGLTVVGVPCNQFMGQEPGTAEEIQQFCSPTYGVPSAAGQRRGQRRRPAPLYAELTKAADADGQAATSSGTSRVLLDPAGTSSTGSAAHETDARVIAAIEAVLHVSTRGPEVGNVPTPAPATVAGDRRMFVSISGSGSFVAAAAAMAADLGKPRVAVSWAVAPGCGVATRLDRDPDTVDWLSARRAGGDAIVCTASKRAHPQAPHRVRTCPRTRRICGLRGATGCSNTGLRTGCSPRRLGRFPTARSRCCRATASGVIGCPGSPT